MSEPAVAPEPRVYTSRKFLLAAFAIITGTVALFAGKLGGTEWVSMVGVVLGLYGGANVAARKL